MIRMRKPPPGRMDDCRQRIATMLRQRRETQRRVERSKEMLEVKLARYVEQKGKKNMPASSAPSGGVSGSGGQTSAAGDCNLMQRTRTRSHC